METQPSIGPKFLSIDYTDFFSSHSPSERLRDSKMQIPSMQTKYRRRSIEKSRWTTLRNQKLRRVQQKTVIHRQRATERRLESKSQSDSVGPMRTQVYGINRRQNISRRHRRRLVLAEQIPNSSKHVAAIVKRHHLDRSRKWNARFEIQDRKRIATDRHSKRIEKHDIFVLISKLTLGNYDFPWTSLFKVETTQRRRTTREESLADRQCPVDLVDSSISITVARIEKVRESECHVTRKHRIPKPVRFVVMPVSCLEAIKRDVSTQLAQGKRVIKAEKTSTRRVDLVVATNLTWTTRLVVVITTSLQQPAFTSLTSVSYK